MGELEGLVVALGFVFTSPVWVNPIPVHNVATKANKKMLRFMGVCSVKDSTSLQLAWSLTMRSIFPAPPNLATKLDKSCLHVLPPEIEADFK
jgi:hypothetical protein